MSISDLQSIVQSFGGGGGEGYKGSRQASFRGVAFGVTDIKDSRGRNVVIHEFPLRDNVLPEDLGRAKRTINVNGFIVGEDYHTGRESLKNACEKEGPGTFMHPYTGAVNVVLTAPVEFTQTVERGVVTFALSFVEVPEESKLGFSLFFPALAQIKAAAAIVEACINLDFAFFLTPGGVLAEAFAFANSLAETAVGIYDAVMTFPRIFETIEGFAKQIAGSVSDLFKGFYPDRNYLAEGGAKAAALEAPKLLALSLDSPVYSIPPNLGTYRSREAANKKAIYDFQREMCAVQGLTAAAHAEFETGAEAKDLRALALKALDNALQNATSDRLFAELESLGNYALKALSNAVKEAPELIHVEHLETGPILPFAWSHAERMTNPGAAADDIIRRNRIRHPGFAPAGLLEMLYSNVNS